VDVVISFFNDSEITENVKKEIAFWPISFFGYFGDELMHEGY